MYTFQDKHFRIKINFIIYTSVSEIEYTNYEFTRDKLKYTYRTRLSKRQQYDNKIIFPLKLILFITVNGVYLYTH